MTGVDSLTSTYYNSYNNGIENNSSINIEKFSENIEDFVKNNEIYFQIDVENSAIDTLSKKLYASFIEENVISLNEKAPVGSEYAEVSTLFTPTRQEGSVTRLSKVDMVTPGENKLWLTEKQTGCTLFIIDWGNVGGGYHYSMLHLAPKDWDENLKILRDKVGEGPDIPANYAYRAFSDIQEARIMTDIYLILSKMELLGKTNQRLPQRFISVPSHEKYYVEERVTQVIGIAEHGQFRFVKQEIIPMGNQSLLQEIHWHNWQELLPKEKDHSYHSAGNPLKA